MRPISALLLDYGNTVVKFDRPQIEWIHRELARALSRFAAPIEPGELGKVMDRICVLPLSSEDLREFTPLEQMERVLGEVYGGRIALSSSLVDEANRELQELFVRSIEIEPLAVQALERLHHRVRVGLVSNYPCPDAIRRSLARTGIASYLDPVVISGEIGFVKPHPKLFAAAVEALGLEPGEILFVGDRWDADMIGARNAGMRTCHHVGYTSEGGHEERYRAYRPDFIIRRFEELEDLVP
jgi:HAD superfamily hydrolase (TIGR01549 family)